MMETHTCNYCKREYSPRRSDAKFCSLECKSKFWYEKRSTAEPAPSSELKSTLKGVINENASKEAISNDKERTTHVMKFETDEYLEIKKEKDRLIVEKSIVEQRLQKILQDIESIKNNNGQLIEIALTGGGVVAADPQFRNPFKNMLGGTGGYFAAKFINALFKDAREEWKRTAIAEKYNEYSRLNDYYTSVCNDIDNVTSRLLTVQQYDTRIVPWPVIKRLDSNLNPINTPDNKRVINDKSVSGAELHDNYAVKPTPITSAKIITSSELIKYNYDALNFQGKWLEFLGQPSVNFRCVIHGMAGEGKSTCAIQFALYLAENFGKVLYVAGEEGFSKTIKDKFIRNHAQSENLHVADLRTFDDIIKEIPVNAYHFIFIDSLNNMRIDAEKLKQLNERYKDSALITICQATKGGQMRGSYEIIHDVDIEIIVAGGIATTNKNRFQEKGREFRVF